MTPHRLAVAAALMASGTALAAKPDPFAGRVAGPPVRCVNTSLLVRNPEVIDSRTIVYRAGRRLWRTGPVDECPGLRPMTTLVVQVYGGRICGGDRFQTLASGTAFPGGPCRFREFTPYDPPKQ